MGEIFKKALGVFVDFKDEEKDQEREEAATASQHVEPVVAVGPAPELDQDPDVARARQAIAMLADLPLAEIPVEKARKLIAGALQLGGLNPADLAGSFDRAAGLYQAAITAESQAIAARHQLNVERIQLLEKALAEEKAQCEAEIAERNRRIDQAKVELTEIEKAMGFFVQEQQ
ncbi:MAG TPA: hypothetical protein VNT75_11505 [Symbiobacteriaceae bacterium]|nr:hypothetical protein [Symbiobacteriaceae bacterium]